MHESILNNLTFNRIRSFTQDRVEFSFFIHSEKKSQQQNLAFARNLTRFAFSSKPRWLPLKSCRQTQVIS